MLCHSLTNAYEWNVPVGHCISSSNLGIRLDATLLSCHKWIFAQIQQILWCLPWKCTLAFGVPVSSWWCFWGASASSLENVGMTIFPLPIKVQWLSQEKHSEFFVVVQSVSCVQLFVTPRTVAGQASLPFTISLYLLKLMFIESVMPSNHLILCLLLLLLPSIFPNIRVFSHQVAKVLHDLLNELDTFSWNTIFAQITIEREWLFSCSYLANVLSKRNEVSILHQMQQLTAFLVNDKIQVFFWLSEFVKLVYTTMGLTIFHYLKASLMKAAVILTNVIFLLVLCSEICQHLKNLHNSLNWYFPNDRCNKRMCVKAECPWLPEKAVWIIHSFPTICLGRPNSLHLF